MTLSAACANDWTGGDTVAPAALNGSVMSIAMPDASTAMSSAFKLTMAWQALALKDFAMTELEVKHSCKCPRSMCQGLEFVCVSPMRNTVAPAASKGSAIRGGR